MMETSPSPSRQTDDASGVIRTVVSAEKWDLSMGRRRQQNWIRRMSLATRLSAGHARNAAPLLGVPSMQASA